MWGVGAFLKFLYVPLSWLVEMIIGLCNVPGDDNGAYDRSAPDRESGEVGRDGMKGVDTAYSALYSTLVRNGIRWACVSFAWRSSPRPRGRRTARGSSWGL
ncbi:hypothetical protein B0J12DRAFT_649723 [Macrophomina phaseolina]|uniref:Uncharacterized protein n=1 Tax=Macrophomina phaseolina TaxID=35725 RepID=A0ABQ8GMI4_9PEZI|nr:hypothetical protein B0J12DRAFT_649723 [Macrophomina phaseolina]